MYCFTCKGGNLKENLTTYVSTLKSCVIIVKNVPSLVCEQCGEVYYNNDIVLKLEKIINTMEKFVEDVAIVEYSKMIA